MEGFDAVMGNDCDDPDEVQDADGYDMDGTYIDDDTDDT